MDARTNSIYSNQCNVDVNVCEQRLFKRHHSESSFENKRSKLESGTNENYIDLDDSSLDLNNDNSDSAAPPMSPARASTPPMDHLLKAPRKPAGKRLYFGRIERIPMRQLADITDNAVFSLL